MSLFKSIDQNAGTLYCGSIFIAASLMWLAPRLPMIDLPQHAAQVALWRDLLLGQSPWADLVHINLLTPYLIGYGLLLPFSLLFSMDIATRIVLSLAFLAFVAACHALAREFGADRRLSWLFLLPFFGFAWKFGFFTFLIASPVALLFLLLALRHARQPSTRRSIILVLAGVVLLFSHGLLFLAALFLGGLMMLEQVFAHSPRQIVARFAPYLALAALTLIFRLLTQDMDGAMRIDGYNYGVPLLERPASWLISIGDMDNTGTRLLPLASLLALCAPLLFGCRCDDRTALVLLGGLVILLCALPMTALQTGRLYERFALFLPPFIVFICRERLDVPSTPIRAILATSLLSLSCLVFLAVQANRILAFGQESQPFETILQAAHPGKRALAIILDQDSAATATSHLYMHYGAWYEAEKLGFVDFNFANFHPQVVRFRPGRAPLMDGMLSFAPKDFGWSDFDSRIYDYFIFKGKPDAIADWIAKSPCTLTRAAQDGDWALLERGTCPP